MRGLIRVVLASLLSIASASAIAAPPQTLGYQGHLADSGGNPITADLSITFRLYDVVSGGSSLWSEVQPAVQVDGGNMAVQLGKVTPLPSSVWGKQLYLGIQIAGDSEMAPRPPLTAAPFALRAGGTMKNTIVVSAEGTALENGAALLAAVAGTSAASASQPVAVELDAGTFDLGTSRLNVPSFVSLVGRGQDSTVITSANVQGTVMLASDSQARRFTARNTGQPPDDNSAAFGIGAATQAFDGTTVTNVTIENVTGESTAASGTPGARWGIYFCASTSRITNSIGRGEGGSNSFGIRADCLTTDNMLVDGLTLISSGGAAGVRGAYWAGGGVWSNVKVFIDQSASTGVNGIFGIRLTRNDLGVGAGLINALVSINGDNQGGVTTPANVEGLRIDVANPNVVVKGAVVLVQNVKAVTVYGIRVNADNTGQRNVHISDADVRVTAVQLAAQGPGTIVGLYAQGAAPELVRSKIKVECLPGGYNFCGGALQSVNSTGTGLQPGALVLDQVSIEVGHDAPADISAQSVAFQPFGAARVENSTLRVLLSASDETQSGVNTTQGGGTPDVRIHNSTVEIISANAGGHCALANGGGGTIEFLGGYLDGSNCGTPVGSIVCAGVTKRGVGFLANSCN